MSINRVTISGNLTRDSEVRYTKSGMPVLSFSIAVNDRRKNAHGEWEDYANYVECTMFGSRAEKISRYLSKGTHVALDGKLRYSTWERDGNKRSKLEVIVDDIDFKSGAKQDSSRNESVSKWDSDEDYVEASIYEDESIPF